MTNSEITNLDDDDHPVLDRLVLEYVERRTAAVDSSALVERIRDARQPVVSATASPTGNSLEKISGRGSWGSRAWSRLMPWWSLSAVAIVLAFFCGRQLGPPFVDAAVILRDVQSEHARNVDHCYRVRFDPDPRYWNPDHPLEGPSLSRLWTRGDRFWADCEIGDIQFKVGREANGSVWISPSREKGIRFSNRPENLPKTVDQLCQINSMSVPRLVKEVLADFDLTSRNTRDPLGEGRTVIWAQLKPGRTHSLLQHALLEVDDRTNTLVRLVLWTTDKGKPRGTVAFTLLESASLDDRQYELDSHLSPGAMIETQTLPSPDYRPDLSESPESP